MTEKELDDWRERDRMMDQAMSQTIALDLKITAVGVVVLAIVAVLYFILGPF